jgi:hypothetical protein
MRVDTGYCTFGSLFLYHYFTEKRYTATMTDSLSINGRLLALNWPSQTSEATLSVDMNATQVATAEIEDAAGTTHQVKVNVNWDADSLVGKLVKTTRGDEGTSLCCAE